MSKVLSSLLKQVSEECVGVFVVFLEYLVYPREGYFEVNKQNIDLGMVKPPILTKQMIEYCLKNILPYRDVLNYPEFVGDIEDEFDGSNLKVLFAARLSAKFKEEYLKLVKNAAIIEPYAVTFFSRFLRKYISFVSMKAGEIDLQDSANQLQRSRNISTVVGLANPVSYGFGTDSENYVMGSMCWVLTGLTDWLEKVNVDAVDVNVMTRIIIPASNKIAEFTTSQTQREVIEYLREHIYQALLKHDLYIDQEGLDVLCRVFYQINHKGGEVLNHVVKYCRIV